MPSLRQLLTDHGSALLLDAASTRVQVGWFSSAEIAAARWETSDEETGVGLFRCIEKLGIEVNAAGAFIFCEGPGSVLGVRTCAMALRTWSVLKPRPMFAYSSLAVVAQAVGRPEVGVIADARRDSWHHLTLGGKVRRLPTAELTGELVTPENFRHWSTPPVNLKQVPYSLAAPLPQPSMIEADLFRAIDAPDAFLHEEPSYVMWTPQIHRAPKVASAME